MKQIFTALIAVFILLGCGRPEGGTNHEVSDLFIEVLGVAQDAGYPQLGCDKECCKHLLETGSTRAYVTSLALVDKVDSSVWLFEASPDIRYQWSRIHQLTGKDPDGIFLTHAHIGHYAGLMELGKESINADGQAVYAMPRMKEFLTGSGPWSQLVSTNNISFRDLKADSTVVLNERLKVSPFRVPHRDEYSETVGYRIKSPDRTVIFIPDIDKWDRWDRSILKEIAACDVALLDGTFFESGELPGRNMSEIPHPFVSESMELFSKLPEKERNKVQFIHFNHTNRLLRDPNAIRQVEQEGFHVSRQGQQISLN